MNRELHERSSHVEAVLDEFRAAGDERATERAEELVRALMGLYAVGLGRVVDLARESALLRRLAEDEVISSLLVLHDLHPDDASTRDPGRPGQGAALPRLARWRRRAHGRGRAGSRPPDAGGQLQRLPLLDGHRQQHARAGGAGGRTEVVAVDVTGVVAPRPAQPLLQIGLRPGLEPRGPG